MSTTTPAANLLQYLSHSFYRDSTYRLTKSCLCVVTPESDNTVVLGRIASQVRGQGQGSEGLRKFIALCDQYGCDVTLEVDPFTIEDSSGEPPLSQFQLVLWYERHGFTITSNSSDSKPRMFRPAMK